jgi:hypothetical protein
MFIKITTAFALRSLPSPRTGVRWKLLCAVQPHPVQQYPRAIDIIKKRHFSSRLLQGNRRCGVLLGINPRSDVSDGQEFGASGEYDADEAIAGKLERHRFMQSSRPLTPHR